MQRPNLGIKADRGYSWQWTYVYFLYSIGLKNKPYIKLIWLLVPVLFWSWKKTNCVILKQCCQLTPSLLQVFKVDSWTSRMLYWKLQVSLSHQFTSNRHAAKPWFSSTVDFQFFAMCIHSSIYTSFIIFNLKPLSRKSCLISLTIIICHKFAYSCQNLPHVRPDACFTNKLGKTRIKCDKGCR